MLCPVAAETCWKTMSFGFGGMPSSAMPAATAPEVTKTILLPCLIASAIWSTSFRISSVLRIPPFLVRLPVPTFTTISFEDIATLLSLKIDFSYKAYQKQKHDSSWIFRKKQLCPICKHELKPMRYVGCDPITFSWIKHDGYFDYYDSSGRVAWVDAPEKYPSNSGSHQPVEEETEVKLHEAIRLKDRVVFRVKEGHGDLDKYTKEENEAFDAYIEDCFRDV